MFKSEIKSLIVILLIFTVCLVKFTQAGVIKSPVISDNVKEDFEKEVRIETENFLNNLFTTQMAFFNKFKTSLNPDSKRYQDIEQFVTKLEIAREEKELEKKDVIYWESFKEFNQIPLVINEEAETGMSDEEFANALTSNGFRELLKNFLADVAVYFWKMAKASGKVVETTLDEYIEEMQKSKSLM